MQQIFLKVFYVPGAVVGTWDTQILLEETENIKWNIINIWKYKRMLLLFSHQVMSSSFC